MDFHLERGLRLNTEPKDKNLYSWAINEIDAQGQQIGDDQIPWGWTLFFTATSCVLIDSIDIDHLDKTTSAPKIARHQVIRAELRPETTFSMFGTDRAIEIFRLEIHPIADPAKQESCTAWGSVSYTIEDDFGYETTKDCIIFSLRVKPEAFACYAAKISRRSVDEMMLAVGSVAGLYSEWSPSVSTHYVKVLTGGNDQKIALPPGLQFEPLRLGDVGTARLHFSRRLEFGKQGPHPRAVKETV